MAESTGRGGSFAEAFRAALGAVAEPPRPSYKAKSAEAQYKHLASTRRGRAALQAAGLTATRQTQQRWLTGKQKPSKANGAKIASAYGEMRRGGIPRAVKAGEMQITGRVGTGRDIRNRGTGRQSPLKVRLSRGRWGRIERLWNTDLIGDGDLEDMISEDLIEPDIGGSDNWFFPGGNYTVTLDY
jgi:hypothetical protein